jgi:hypothetical protein
LQEQVDPSSACNTDWLFAIDFGEHPGVNANDASDDWFRMWHVLGLICRQSVPIVSRNCNPPLLDPIPELDFYEGQHRYRWRGNWILNNVSDVLSDDLTPYAKSQIEKYKNGPDGWLVRGETIHRSLDRYLRSEVDMHDDKWSPWIDTLLSDDLFQGVETLATEYRVVDRYNSVAGSFDFLLRYEDDPSFVILGDLKTVSSRKAVSGRKPATAQLGAYAKMLQQWHAKLTVTECVTVVSGPEKCKVIRQDPCECMNAWEEAWGRFQAKQAVSDF